MSGRFYFILVCLWLSACTANATVMQTLYDTRVLVSGQNDAAQRNAFRDSLQQVLVKVSGDRDIAGDSFVRQQLPNARNYIRAFRYEFDEGLRFMVASFDEQRVNRLVVESGYPVWGKRRPDTLLWVAFYDSNSARSLITAGAELPIKDAFMDAGEGRGIPFTFPLMDIQDSEVINVFDVWGRFDDTIKLASQRYPNDNLISARIFNRNVFLAGDETVPENMVWQLDWQILNKELVQQSTFFGSDMYQVIEQFVDFIADTLAEKYAVNSLSGLSSGNVLSVKIINMDSIESYVTVTRFFESLSLVNTATLTQLQGAVGVFDLDLTGSKGDLLNTLLLDDKITQQTDAFGQTREELEFYWLP